MGTVRHLGSFADMNRTTTASTKRRPKTSTLVVLGVVAIAGFLLAVGGFTGADLTAVFQGVENAFDGPQGRRF